VVHSSGRHALSTCANPIPDRSDSAFCILHSAVQEAAILQQPSIWRDSSARSARPSPLSGQTNPRQEGACLLVRGLGRLSQKRGVKWELPRFHPSLAYHFVSRTANTGFIEFFRETSASSGLLGQRRRVLQPSVCRSRRRQPVLCILYGYAMFGTKTRDA
jgi:hypothetical protein